MVDLWLVVALALGAAAILIILRRTVFPPERDDPVVVARAGRNLGRRGLRRCPRCEGFLPIAQAECLRCGSVSEPEA